MPFPPALGLVKGILIAKLLAPPKKEKKSYHHPPPSYRHQQPYQTSYQVLSPQTLNTDQLPYCRSPTTDMTTTPDSMIHSMDTEYLTNWLDGRN